jgi:hypothetical protein
MNKKLLKKKIEQFLKFYGVCYQIEEDREKEKLWVNLFSQSKTEEHPELGNLEIYIGVYRNYLYFHLLGWECVEKVEKSEDIPFLDIFSILELFFQKKLKIQVTLSGDNKAYEWKIYVFKDYRWELISHSQKFWKKIFASKKKLELNVDDLMLEKEGGNVC